MFFAGFVTGILFAICCALLLVVIAVADSDDED
jgi:MFS superfamily sulfate permease-like transporter